MIWNTFSALYFHFVYVHRLNLLQVPLWTLIVIQMLLQKFGANIWICRKVGALTIFLQVMYFIGAIFSVLFCLFSTILFFPSLSYQVWEEIEGQKLRKGGSFTIFHSYSFLSDIWRGATLQGRVHEESRKVSYIFLSFSFLYQVREEKEGQDEDREVSLGIFLSFLSYQ